MTTIAQLSDLHLIAEPDKTSMSSRMREALLGLGHRATADVRRQRARRALARARASSADHIVITGDLTETGTAAEFEVVAEILHDSGIDPTRVTLVPGNHDMY